MAAWLQQGRGPGVREGESAESHHWREVAETYPSEGAGAEAAGRSCSSWTLRWQRPERALSSKPAHSRCKWLLKQGAPVGVGGRRGPGRGQEEHFPVLTPTSGVRGLWWWRAGGALSLSKGWKEDQLQKLLFSNVIFSSGIL